jgi:hypothetical protein
MQAAEQALAQAPAGQAAGQSALAQKVLAAVDAVIAADGRGGGGPGPGKPSTVNGGGRMLLAEPA